MALSKRSRRVAGRKPLKSLTGVRRLRHAEAHRRTGVLNLWNPNGRTYAGQHRQTRSPWAKQVKHGGHPHGNPRGSVIKGQQIWLFASAGAGVTSEHNRHSARFNANLTVNVAGAWMLELLRSAGRGRLHSVSRSNSGLADSPGARLRLPGFGRTETPPPGWPRIGAPVRNAGTPFLLAIGGRGGGEAAHGGRLCRML